MSPTIILLTVCSYLALLFLLSYLSGRNTGNADFFVGGRKSHWLMVAFAMIGSSISGVTFVSVPGMVATNSLSYLQMILGFMVGQFIIAFVLVPLFYHMKLVSIYGYLRERFGIRGYKTGAWLFLISKMLGAAVRLYLFSLIMQFLVFEPFGLPFWLNVSLSLLLIVLYTFRGGVKSLIWTDCLKTLCLLLAVGLSIYYLMKGLDYSFSSMITHVQENPMSRWLFLDDVNSKSYFWKLFFAGIFIMIATTGLDQDMMQRNISCRNSRESQLNMFVSAIMQFIIVALFLFLGILLYSYAEAYHITLPAESDKLFPMLATRGFMPTIVGVCFVIGLTASAISSGGSALTSLTTSFTIDIIGTSHSNDRSITRLRHRVHLLMAIVMGIVMVNFHILNSTSVIDAVYTLASYTYGPILGLFLFGLLSKRNVRDVWIPSVVIFSPILCYVLQLNASRWLGGYQFSYELLLVNAFIVYVGLWIFSLTSRRIGRNRRGSRRFVRSLLLFVILSTTSFVNPSLVQAQTRLSTTRCHKINEAIATLIPKNQKVDEILVQSVTNRHGKVTVYLNDAAHGLPYDEKLVERFYNQTSAVLPQQWQHIPLSIQTKGIAIEQLVPLYRRTPTLQLVSRKAPDIYTSFSRTKRVAQPLTTPLVTSLSSSSHPTQGLANRHIALMPSHGFYYEKKTDRWEWQRARLNETVEDLLPMSLVISYLAPMLEHAGANVLIPRERDTQTSEVIMHSIPGLSQWTPQIPHDGHYGVYVQYKYHPHNTTQAHYTVCHKGIKTQFAVNQQMGASTWIFLGTFNFSANHPEDNYVQLDNKVQSMDSATVIACQAVKFGGGMGSISRGGTISHYPRFAEAARYWMQYANIPDSIYNSFHDTDDYKDDYMCRGAWVNYLAGGSSVLPKDQGLQIPIDLALALHTDAGIYEQDSITGTLAIFNTYTYDGRYPNGASRVWCRDLADQIVSQLATDIRKVYEPDWTRRQLFDKAYFEARIPKVPTLLLELLSHQSYQDMRYGLDPSFRFLVSRSIYKGILRFLGQQYNQEVTVQPLPPDHFSVLADTLDAQKMHLSWLAVNDSLEPSAKPTSYMLYTRVDDGDFDNGILIKGNSYQTIQKVGHLYAYQVTAVNAGGESMPSQTLAAGVVARSKGTVLVVNAFDRVSGPYAFSDSIVSGFHDQVEYPLPDGTDISYVGSQYLFQKKLDWLSDDMPGVGASRSTYEGKILAGNTHDYVVRHGKSIMASGYSFCGISDEALIQQSLTNSAVPLVTQYPVVDFILGKQRTTLIGKSGYRNPRFVTYLPSVQRWLQAYTLGGGNLFVSGAYVLSDAWGNPLLKEKTSNRDFLQDVLHITYQTDRAAITGKVQVTTPNNQKQSFSMTTYHYQSTPSDSLYVVEAPDAILPADSHAASLMMYPENNTTAAVGYQGKYRTFIMGFPFEVIHQQSKRDSLMKEILHYLTKK